MVGEKNSKKMVLIPWLTMIFVSAFPNIILREGLNTNLPWLRWAKIGVLLVLFMISVFNKKLFPLRQYFGVFLAVFITTEAIIMLRATEQWKIWFGGDTPSFVQHMLRKQLLSW